MSSAVAGLLLVLVCLVQGEGLYGEGITHAALFIGKLVYGYQQTSPGFELNFTAGGQTAGVNRMKTGAIDYAIAQSRVQYRDAHTVSFPWIAQSYGFCYNLPFLGANRRLNLTSSLIIGIYNATITRWNDPAILAVNPDMSPSLSDARIDVYTRAGNTATTFVFYDYMRSIDPSYPYYNIGNFPPAYAKQKNITLTADSADISLFHPLYSINYTLAFVPIPVYQSFAISTHVQCANIIGNTSSSSSSLQTPWQESVKSQLQNAIYNTSIGDVSLPYKADGWPITSISYLFLNTGNYSNCEKRRELLKFFRWSLLSPNAFEPLYSDGYVIISERLREEVLEQINLLTCEGSPSLQYEVLAGIAPSTYIPFFVIDSVFLVGIVFMGIFMNFRYEKKTIGKIYNGVIILAACLSYAGLISYAIFPSSAVICQCRVWFTFLSVSIFLAAIFVRNIQMKSIQNIVDKGLFKKKINNMMILRVGLSVIVGIELLILLVWQFLDPAVNTMIVESNWDLTARVVCFPQDTHLWYNIEFGYFVLLSLFGVFIVYSTWNIRKQVDDARMIAVSVYVVLIVQIGSFFIINPLMHDTDIFFWAHVYLLGTEVTFCFSIFVPKFARLHKSNSSTGSPSTTAESAPIEVTVNHVTTKSIQ